MVSPEEEASEDQAAPAVAAEEAAEEPAAKKEKVEDATASEAPAPEMPKQWRNKDPASAMLWFYRDSEGKRQGPFYPGQMRQWFTLGFFKADQLVAPSFKGEMPRDFVPIERFYSSDVQKEAAFVAREGIALWPAAQAQPQPEDDYDAESVSRGADAQRPQWLEDSIRRQRAGIKRKMIYGPTERENYN